MLASYTRVGWVVSACATHVTAHAFRTASPLLFRDQYPGAEASGHVCTIVNATENASAASVCRAGIGRGTGA